jgi:hypothetical protein
MFRDGVSAQDIAKYLLFSEFLIQDNMMNIQKAVENRQKPDKLFTIMSSSSQFMIRAVTEEEHKTFTRRMVESYYYRVISDSFLQHIYAVFKFTLKGNVYRIVLQDNPSYILQRPFCIRVRGQKTKASTELILQNFKASSDLDEASTNPSVITEFNSETIHLKPEHIDKVCDILSKDLELMKEFNIVNYDLKVYSSIYPSKPIKNRLIFSGEAGQTSILLCISRFFLDESSSHSRRKKRLSSLLTSQDYSASLELKLRSTFSRLI